MSEPEWPPARILNLLICAALSAFFVAELAGFRPLPWPQGWLERVLFWAGGPSAIAILLIEAFVAWSTWADDRHVRRHEVHFGTKRNEQ